MATRLTMDEAIKYYTEHYNWDLWATLPQTQGKQYIDDIGINIILHQDSGDFELIYKVPYTVFKLDVRAGSFNNIEHFNNMYVKFTSLVASINTNPLVNKF